MKNTYSKYCSSTGNFPIGVIENLTGVSIFPEGKMILPMGIIIIFLRDINF